MTVAACAGSGGPAQVIRSQTRTLDVGPGGGSYPDIAVASSAAVYLLSTQSQKGNVELRISHDGGDTFAAVLPVSPPGMRAVVHGENSPRLAVTPTVTHVLWESVGERGLNRINYSRSVDFGRSFLPPNDVTAKAEPSFNGFATMAASTSGTVGMAWLDGRNPSRDLATFDLYATVSTDHGASFDGDVLVASDVCPCCRPALAIAQDGRVFIAWRQVFEGQVRDIVVASSADGGRTFGTPVRVAVDGWVLSGCPHSGPALALVGERLVVAWFTAAAGAQPGIRTAWSDDGGKSFAPFVHASADVLDANHPDLSVSEDGRVALSFQGRSPTSSDGWSPLQPWLVELTDGELPGVPMPLATAVGAATYPALATDAEGRAHLAWTEPGEAGSTQVVLGRTRRTVAQGESPK